MSTRSGWFRWTTGELLFGWGAATQLGAAATSHGIRNALVVVDPAVRSSRAYTSATASLRAAGIGQLEYDRIVVEPTDESLNAAAAECRGDWDGVVAIGGGSTLDTAKGIRLLAENGGTITDFAQPPVGAGRRPATSGIPLIALPTTAGSGSESSGVCVIGVSEGKLKTGISDPTLRPSLAIVDPDFTMTTPPGPTISAALDVLCHALESLTSRPYHCRGPFGYATAPVFMGANPFSDVLCRDVVSRIARSLPRVVNEPDDLAARGDLALASAISAAGSGTAGVHIPHALSYSVAAGAREFSVAGWTGQGWAPHGLVVASTAASTFEWTHPSNPELHLELARLLNPERRTEAADQRQLLPQRLQELLDSVGARATLHGFGYDRSDVPTLAAATLTQNRLLTGSPQEATVSDLHQILENSYE
jgi:alcohol dehydrogenase class IV